jgi:hypothetical protein
MRWIADATRATHREPEVHFHAGPDQLPAVCYDEQCRNPRMDVAPQV